jgi:Glycosyltransferases, probably involved in cell wall biogenesis
MRKEKISSGPLVSIIVPTLNSEKTIEKCLTGIKNQTYHNIEIIVVDAGSDDMTVEIANQGNVNVIDANIKNVAKQTNIGAKMSKGEYIYRLDSDVVLSSYVVQECVEKCENGDCEAVSTYWGPDPSISFWAKIRKFEKDCYKYDSSRNVSRFYKKKVFDEIGGYNENITFGEDYDIQNRIKIRNYKIGFVEAEGLHLGEPTTLKEVISKQYYYGRTMKAFLKENKSRGLIQVSPIRKSFLINWKKFVKNPFLTLSFLFYEIIYYSSAIAGYLKVQ